MTPEQRLEYMRKRLGRGYGNKGKPMGLFLAENPEVGSAMAKTGYVKPIGRKGAWRGVFGLIDGPRRQMEWETIPDGVPAKPCATKRLKHVHPLTRIAQQLPVKLPVLSVREMRYKLGQR